MNNKLIEIKMHRLWRVLKLAFSFTSSLISIPVCQNFITFLHKVLLGQSKNENLTLINLKLKAANEFNKELSHEIVIDRNWPRRQSGK